MTGKPSLYLNIHVFFPWVISVEKIIQMYSSIPSGEKEKIDICLFSLFIAVVLTWQHIKKGKEKTHGASEGVSALKKK